MSTYVAKCDICGTENTVASYGDWDCGQCGQGYTYDECHQIRLTDAQCALLRRPPRWIPVKDRLPDDFDEDVLVFVFDNLDPDVKHPAVGLFERGSGWRVIGFPETTVTHWMPLPEPPK